MEHLSNDHEDHPNQHENSHKLCNEMGHPVLNLIESQWKLRQQDCLSNVLRRNLFLKNAEAATGGVL